MAYYSIEDRKRLGRFIGRARRAAGFADTEKWAEKIDRSTRVALGVERGESTSAKTYEAIEAALGWHPGACFEVLDGVSPEEAIRGLSVGGPEQDATYVEGPGPKVEGGASDDAVLRAIAEMRQDMQDMEQRLSERLDRLEESGS